jgi:hypothetical protein
MGALLECGAALAAGKRVFLVSPHPWTFKHHPRVRIFNSLEDAVTAIVAATNGEMTEPRLRPGELRPC